MFLVDVDECAEGTHRCDVNAVCTNTQDSYECYCYDGYQGDGYNCQREEEEEEEPGKINVYIFCGMLV